MKVTNEIFKDRVSKINPQFDILDDYAGAETKLRYVCKDCGYNGEMTPHNLYKKRKCPICAEKSRRKLKTKTNEQFISELKVIFPEYSVIGEYTKAKNKVKCFCNIHDIEFESLPTNLLKGKIGCPECNKINRGMSLRKTHEEFLNELKCVNDRVEVLTEYITSEIYVKARCKICDYVWDVKPSNLLIGCGCPICKASKGEIKIAKYLKENNILFKAQKTFDGLIGLGGGELLYDFYLPEYNLLIEYQGEQHIRPVSYFGGEEGLKKQQKHDELKRNYATDNNIKLIEIWYYDFDNIENILNNILIPVTTTAA